MKTKTEKILAAMNVLSWVTFIGLLIKAGAILITYGVSIGNPDGAKDLYRGLNLYTLRQYDLWYYTSAVSFMVSIAIMEAYMAYLVIRVLSKIKLASPFTIEVAKLLEKISYVIFGIWIIAMLFNGYTKWLLKRVEGMPENWTSGEFIFLAGVVFLISQIFKKGVELQSENELTV
jgi:hypothetical protein